MFEHRSEYRKSEYTRGMRDTAWSPVDLERY